MGLARRKAIFRPGLGCTVLIGATEKELRSQIDLVSRPSIFDGKEQLWPAGERVQTQGLPPEVDSKKLNDALDEAFSEPDPQHLRRTRAVVVVYNGRIIAERYAPGFSHNTALMGWSMAKSVMNALVGILVREGKLSLQDSALVPEWREPNDPRRNITLDHLLQVIRTRFFWSKV